jgi:hypothetical protein
VDPFAALSQPAPVVASASVPAYPNAYPAPPVAGWGAVAQQHVQPPQQQAYYAQQPGAPPAHDPFSGLGADRPAPPSQRGQQQQRAVQQQRQQQQQDPFGNLNW